MLYQNHFVTGEDKDKFPLDENGLSRLINSYHMKLISQKDEEQSKVIREQNAQISLLQQ